MTLSMHQRDQALEKYNLCVMLVHICMSVKSPPNTNTDKLPLIKGPVK